MPIDLALLLSKADGAKPVGRLSAGKWVHLWPLYEKLRSQRFTGREAVEWMVKEKVIEATEHLKAESAFRKLTGTRRRQAERRR